MNFVTSERLSFALAACLMTLTSPAALANQRTTEQKAASDAVMRAENVEQILDDVSKYQDKTVVVPGEIQEKLDSRSFVLESGGLLNDEIVVISAPRTREADVAKLREDTDVLVAGTLRAVPVVEIKRELSWDLDPQVEAELQGVKTFIVAHSVSTPAKKK